MKPGICCRANKAIKNRGHQKHCKAACFCARIQRCKRYLGTKISPQIRFHFCYSFFANFPFCWANITEYLARLTFIWVMRKSYELCVFIDRKNIRFDATNAKTRFLGVRLQSLLNIFLLPNWRNQADFQFCLISRFAVLIKSIHFWIRLLKYIAKPLRFRNLESLSNKTDS